MGHSGHNFRRLRDNSGKFRTTDDRSGGSESLKCPISGKPAQADGEMYWGVVQKWDTTGHSCRPGDQLYLVNRHRNRPAGRLSAPGNQRSDPDNQTLDRDRECDEPKSRMDGSASVPECGPAAGNGSPAAATSERRAVWKDSWASGLRGLLRPRTGALRERLVRRAAVRRTADRAAYQRRNVGHTERDGRTNDSARFYAAALPTRERPGVRPSPAAVTFERRAVWKDS